MNMEPIPPSSSLDLTPTIAKYLEPQLLVPILLHLAETDLYPQDQVLSQLFSIVVDSTARADLARDIADRLEAAGIDRPSTADIEARADEIEKSLANPDDAVSKMLDVLASCDEQLRSTNRSGACAIIQEQCDISAEDIDKLYEYAKLHYMTGKFTEAITLLDQYRSIAPNYKLSLSGAWGKLAALLLSHDNQQEALIAINRVRDTIEIANLPTPSHILQQRLWQLHWSLFVVFKVENGLDRCYDLLFKPESMNAMETAAPWLFRYVVAASVLSQYKHAREIARNASFDRIRMNDPLCRVYEHLLVQIDFDSASEYLVQVQDLVKVDYFLHQHGEALLHALRKQFLVTLSKVFVQLPLDQLLGYLHTELDQLEPLATDLPNATTLQVCEDGQIVSFILQPQTRRNVHEKVDKLSHQSDNTMAQLYKKM